MGIEDKKVLQLIAHVRSDRAKKTVRRCQI